MCLVLVVSSISWVAFMVIYSSYVVREEIDTLRLLLSKGKLTAGMYMEHYRRVNLVNDGHWLHEMVMIVGYVNLLLYIVMLLVGLHHTLLVLYYSLLFGREGYLALYLLPFFASTNDSFKEFLDDCTAALIDSDSDPDSRQQLYR
jgi:hypothetical protein